MILLACPGLHDVVALLFCTCGCWCWPIMILQGNTGSGGSRGRGLCEDCSRAASPPATVGRTQLSHAAINTSSALLFWHLCQT